MIIPCLEWASLRGFHAPLDSRLRRIPVFAGESQPMRRIIILIALLVLLSGCATAETGHQITMEQAAWISTGVTTRSEVVERFGAPNFELPDPATTTIKNEDTHTPTTTIQVQSPKSTRATY